MIWPIKFPYSWIWLEKEVLTRQENVNIRMAFTLKYNVFIYLFEKICYLWFKSYKFQGLVFFLGSLELNKFSWPADTATSISSVSQLSPNSLAFRNQESCFCKIDHSAIIPFSVRRLAPSQYFMCSQRASSLQFLVLPKSKLPPLALWPPGEIFFIPTLSQAWERAPSPSLPKASLNKGCCVKRTFIKDYGKKIILHHRSKTNFKKNALYHKYIQPFCNR